jgi:hypothetical protein
MKKSNSFENVLKISEEIRNWCFAAFGENLKRLILFVTILSGYPGTGTPSDWTGYGSRSDLSKPS